MMMTASHNHTRFNNYPQGIVLSNVAPVPPAVSDKEKVLASRFRTKICANWAENSGFCPYEARCMFAHGKHELRTTEMNIRDSLTTEDNIRTFKRYLELKAKGVDVRPPPFLKSAQWEAAAANAVTHPASANPLSQECSTVVSGTTTPASTTLRSHTSVSATARFRFEPYSFTATRIYIDTSSSLDTMSAASGDLSEEIRSVAGSLESFDEEYLNYEL